MDPRGPNGYRIEPARPEHVPCLPGIERAAGRLFENTDLGTDIDADDTTSVEEFEQARRDGQLWVAVAPDGSAAGFALAHRHGGQAHLEELDVLPEHGRRGLGARLVDAVCAWARSVGLEEVTLTTFRDVPWNGPYYERLGFEAIPDAALSPELREIVSEEAERGLDPARRVVMRRRL